jgi:hypothetical protein
MTIPAYATLAALCVAVLLLSNYRAVRTNGTTRRVVLLAIALQASAAFGALALPWAYPAAAEWCAVGIIAGQVGLQWAANRDWRDGQPAQFVRARLLCNKLHPIKTFEPAQQQAENPPASHDAKTREAA